MARVRALTRVFVDNGLREEGTVFEYEGPFNRHLEYLDAAEIEGEAVEVEPADAGKAWKPKAKRAVDKSSV